jgi:2-polyprenyl-3-methyl-5-hydroxy-6-metoxy-1,4-benzoquinol methylase
MIDLLHCPTCGASSSEATCVLTSKKIRLGRRSHEGKWFPSRLIRCRCSHGFLNPQPSFDELSGLYDDDYFGVAPPPIGEELDKWMAWAHQGDRMDGVRIKPGGRFLDIGCGRGLLVAAMARVGMEAEGLEPSKYAAARAREAGLNIRCALLHEVGYPPGRFDAISMYHVLEHTDDPLQVLRECRRILKPGGELVVGVPNFDSLVFALVKSTWNGLQLPTHLQHFTPASIRIMAESAGFVVESMRTDSTKDVVAAELANWLRFRFLLPRRLTLRSKLIGLWASRLARRGNASGRGEAICIRLIAP